MYFYSNELLLISEIDFENTVLEDTLMKIFLFVTFYILCIYFYFCLFRPQITIWCKTFMETMSYPNG